MILVVVSVTFPENISFGSTDVYFKELQLSFHPQYSRKRFVGTLAMHHEDEVKIIRKSFLDEVRVATQMAAIDILKDSGIGHRFNCDDIKVVAKHIMLGKEMIDMDEYKSRLSALNTVSEAQMSYLKSLVERQETQAVNNMKYVLGSDLGNLTKYTASQVIKALRYVIGEDKEPDFNAQLLDSIGRWEH
jgi:hypothetical protein